MGEIKALAVSVNALTTQAKQLKVVLEIEPDRLREELQPHLEDFITLKLVSQQLIVDSEEANQRCVDLLNQWAVKQKAFTEVWGRFKTPLNAARAVVLKLEKETAGVAEETKQLLARKSGYFQLAMLRAKESAEAHVDRLAARRRLELSAEADELMLDGDVQGAQSKMLEAELTVAPTLPGIGHAEGSRETLKYRAKTTDIIAVLQSIVDGKTQLMHEVKPGDVRPLVVVDQVVLNALVSRNAKLKIPGITVEPDVQVAAGGRRG